MHTPPLAGFERFPFSPHYPALWLPAAVLRELAEPAKASDDNVAACDVQHLLRSLLEKGGITEEQLHRDVLAFQKHQKTQSYPAPPALKNPHLKYISIFDVAGLHARKNEAGNSRNLQAVMKRFKTGDDGERELRPVPPHFMAGLLHLKTSYPNCNHFLDYIGSFALLALRQPYPAFYFPPVLLVGPPGVGKTAVVTAVAYLIGVTSRQVDLAATTAGMVLGGMSTQWSDAKTGIIVDMLRDGTAANPIIILDELDKAASGSRFNPLGPLYNLLEQKTAAKFIDEALDLPADASHVLYVATANTLENISRPLLSRFIVLEIEAITAPQHVHVTQSIYTGLLRYHDCEALFPGKLSKTVVEALRQHSPRVIKGVLRRALAQAAQRSSARKKLTVTAADLLFSSVLLKGSDYERCNPIGFMP